MQLTTQVPRARRWAALLAIALGLATSAARAESEFDVRASSEVSGYADSDHIYVITPTIAATIAKPTSGLTINGRYLVDFVSAASVDIVSTASRRWEEVRHAGSVDAEYKPDTFGVSGSANISVEPDYISWTAGGAVTKDFDEKHYTALFGFYHGHDTGGRTGTPFNVFSRQYDHEAFKAGLTMVVNPETLVSIVGDAIVERGDQSKPYRYVPLFAPGTQVAAGTPPGVVSQLRISARPLEQLPLSRDRFALTGRIAHRFDDMTLRIDERLYADSWALFASTTDVRLLMDVSRRIEMGPRGRFHLQKGVSFWQRTYTLQAGFDYPAYRTGDRELGPLFNATGGATLRWKIGPGSNPSSWVIGFDLSATSTRYFDDLYLTRRLAGFGAISLEVEL